MSVNSDKNEAALTSILAESEFLHKCLKTMKIQESHEEYLCTDYLYQRPAGRTENKKMRREKSSTSVASTSADFSTERVEMVYRQKICEWMYRVVDHFQVSRDLVSISISYLDRYLAATGIGCNTRSFRLASVAALYIACKLFDMSRSFIKAMTLSELSRSEFSDEDIKGMEMQLLCTLKWRMNPPTSPSFVRHIFSILVPRDADTMFPNMLEDSLYFTDLALCDYFFVTKRPSVIALSSMINAIKKRCNFGNLEEADASFLVKHICRICDMSNTCLDVKASQERLWKIYVESDEFKELTTGIFIEPNEPPQTEAFVGSHAMCYSVMAGSPVSVTKGF